MYYSSNEKGTLIRQRVRGVQKGSNPSGQFLLDIGEGHVIVVKWENIN